MEHGPGLPAAKHPGLCGGDSSSKEGHGTTSSKGAGTDLGGSDAQGFANGLGTGAKGIGDALAGDVGSGGGGGVDCVEGSLCRGLVAAKVEDSASHSFEGGQERVLGVAVGEGFIFDSILLVGEVEVNLGGTVDLVGGCFAGIVGGGANDEGYIHEAEGSVLLGGVGVFTGAKKEEETNNDHVSQGLAEDGGLQGQDGMVDQLDGHWFDSLRGGGPPCCRL